MQVRVQEVTCVTKSKIRYYTQDQDTCNKNTSIADILQATLTGYSCSMIIIFLNRKHYNGSLASFKIVNKSTKKTRIYILASYLCYIFISTSKSSLLQVWGKSVTRVAESLRRTQTWYWEPFTKNSWFVYVAQATLTGYSCFGMII